MLLAVVIRFAEESGTKAPNPILPAKNEIIYGFASFVVLYVLMWKLAYPAVKKGMVARSARIESTLASADKAMGDAQTVLSEYRAQLTDAKNEGNRIIEEARQQADAVRKQMLSRAEADVASTRMKAAEDLAAQAERLKADLTTHVKSLSLELAGKVVGANLDTDTNAALVDRYIAELAAK